MIVHVYILVCGLCINEGIPAEDRYRVADSEQGKRQMREHARTVHNVEVGLEEPK
jgi:hypothetical protein